MVRRNLWRVLALAALVLTLFQLGTTSVAAASLAVSPGRIAPNRSGDGLPTTKKMVRVFRSTAGFIHTPPPSVW